MGREARRVPLDFDWPLHQVWEGYLMPERLRGTPCDVCNGGGWSAEARWLLKIAYILTESTAMHGAESVHPYMEPLRNIAYGGDTLDPGADFVALVSGLTGIPPESFGQGLFGRPDTYRVAYALAKKAGLPESFMLCASCAGEGTHEAYPGQRKDRSSWEWEEPPTGEGWQMWETTSEGSPISPVFETPEGLARWCETNASVFGRARADYATWLRIVKDEEIAHVEVSPGVVVM